MITEKRQENPQSRTLLRSLLGVYRSIIERTRDTEDPTLVSRMEDSWEKSAQHPSGSQLNR